MLFMVLTRRYCLLVYYNEAKISFQKYFQFMAWNNKNVKKMEWIASKVYKWRDLNYI